MRQTYQNYPKLTINPNTLRYPTMAQQNFDINQVIQFCIKVITTQYFCFDGRMSKRDYWTFMIPVLILCSVFSWTGIVPLALLLPSLGATARRLHDIGKTGWLQLVSLICPPIGAIVVLVVWCLPDGQKEANQYGEAPTDESVAPAAE